MYVLPSLGKVVGVVNDGEEDGGEEIADSVLSLEDRGGEGGGMNVVRGDVVQEMSILDVSSIFTPPAACSARGSSPSSSGPPLSACGDRLTMLITSNNLARSSNTGCGADITTCFPTKRA